MKKSKNQVQTFYKVRKIASTQSSSQYQSLRLIKVKSHLFNFYILPFLTLSGAQGVIMSVCLSVCLCSTKCSILIFLLPIFLIALLVGHFVLLSLIIKHSFLAPTGAQEVAISVCLSVPSAESCLEHSIFIFQPQILQDDFRMTSSCFQDVPLPLRLWTHP